MVAGSDSDMDDPEQHLFETNLLGALTVQKAFFCQRLGKANLDDPPELCYGEDGNPLMFRRSLTAPRLQ